MEERVIFVEETPSSKIDFEHNNPFIQREYEEIEPQQYSWQDFRQHANIFCRFSFNLFYFCCGVLQFFAIWTALLKVFPNHSFISSITSFVLSFIPYIGTVFGIWATHVAWGWRLSHASIIFTIPYVIVNTPMLFITLKELFADWQRWREERKDEVAF